MGSSLLAVGIIGATVMPHSLFLGSALATQDRIAFRANSPSTEHLLHTSTLHSDDSLSIKSVPEKSTIRRLYENFKESVISVLRKPEVSSYATTAKDHSEHKNNPYEFIRAHIYHGTFDVVGSLIGIAVMVNSLYVRVFCDVGRILNALLHCRILILAAAVFFYGKGHESQGDTASLFDAYDVIRDVVGKPAATLFAIALLCAGQVSWISP